jgi:hypothetical protein
MAKSHPGELTLLGLSFVASVYIVVRSLSELGVDLASIISVATAAADAPQGALWGLTTSRDAFDWYVGLLMGFFTLCSLAMIMFAQKESKISFGKDSSKMILGFIAGFLSGGARPR